MQTFGRILSFIWLIVVSIFVGGRAVLDLIGYATLPEDSVVASERYHRLFLWLLDVPWWALLGTAFVSALVLMWVSWPGAAFPTFARRRDKLRQLASDAIPLIERLRDQERGVLHNQRPWDPELRSDLLAFYWRIGRIGIQYPDAAFDAKEPRDYYAWHAHYLECVRPFLREGERGLAKHAAKTVVATVKAAIHAPPQPPDTESETRP